MAAHKHAEVIKAWADGEEIEYRCIGSNAWSPTAMPSWDMSVEYRVKTTELVAGYPQTKLSPEDLGKAFSEAMLGTKNMPVWFTDDTMGKLRVFANFILQSAVDDGTVPTLEAYEQCAKDLLAAEQRNAERDMVIAKAVCSEINKALGRHIAVVPSTTAQVHLITACSLVSVVKGRLADIIAKVSV